jgi:hypothetical protein
LIELISTNECAGPIPRAFAADSPALAVDSRGEHTKMPDYRAYILGREGLRFLRVTEFLGITQMMPPPYVQRKSSSMATTSNYGTAAAWSPDSIMWTAIRAMISHG